MSSSPPNQHQLTADEFYNVMVTFNCLDRFISEIIVQFINPHAPQGRRFLLEYALNSSVIHFGAKLNLLSGIARTQGWERKEWKPVSDKLRAAMNIRNLFAHCIPKHEAAADCPAANIENLFTDKLQLRTTYLKVDINGGDDKKLEAREHLEKFMVNTNEVIAYLKTKFPEAQFDAGESSWPRLQDDWPELEIEHKVSG